MRLSPPLWASPLVAAAACTLLKLSLPLSRPPSHGMQLDAVCSYLNLWEVADRVRDGIAGSRRHPGYTAGGSARAVSINLDVDVGGMGRWVAGKKGHGRGAGGTPAWRHVPGRRLGCRPCTYPSLPSAGRLSGTPFEQRQFGADNCLAPLACHLGFHGAL